MSVDKVFERRKGTRKIPVEDVATLVRMAGYLRDTADGIRDLFDMQNVASEFVAYADHLDQIVARCGGSPYEEESE